MALDKWKGDEQLGYSSMRAFIGKSPVYGIRHGLWPAAHFEVGSFIWLPTISNGTMHSTAAIPMLN